MKKSTTTFVAAAAMLTLLSWSVAQTPRPELFDSKKAQQELEIMRGILSTTVNIVIKELRSGGQAGTGRLYGAGISSIGAFYLYGQGATFTIPMSSFRAFTSSSGRSYSDLEGAMEAVRANMTEAEAQLAQSRAELEAFRVSGSVSGGRSGTGYGVGTGVGGGVGGGVVGGVPGGVSGGVGPAAPVPPAQPTPPPRAAQAKPEDLQKRLADAQEQVKRRREDVEKQNQKLQEILTQLKGYLIEALANYGDSLTVVKPNEYINLVISTDSDSFVVLNGFAETSGSRGAREIISVQRSVITDYKAGRITLDGFKQKVLQYSE